MKQSKYTIDCFTPQNAGTLYPENSYHADDPEGVAKVIQDCTRKTAGIYLVQVYINIKEDICYDCMGDGLFEGIACDTCHGKGHIEVEA